jgi:hypothetical protein
MKTDINIKFQNILGNTELTSKYSSKNLHEPSKTVVNSNGISTYLTSPMNPSNNSQLDSSLILQNSYRNNHNNNNKTMTNLSDLSNKNHLNQNSSNSINNFQPLNNFSNLYNNNIADNSLSSVPLSSAP